MPTEFHYETNCCGEEHTEVDHLKAGDAYRDWCDECNWFTMYRCTEKVVVDERGDVL